VTTPARPSQFSQDLAAKLAAYSAGQVEGFYDEGGAGKSLRTLGTATGATLGGLAGIAASIKSRSDDRNSLGSKLMGLFGGSQPGGLDLKQDLGTGAIGAIAGGIGGHMLGSMAERYALAKNKRYATAEQMTGIPRSKLEELPMATRLHLLGAAAHQQQKTSEEFSAAQLREYQRKHIEPNMAAAMDVTGSVGGTMLGYAAGGAIGDNPAYRYGGAVAGAFGGMLAARHARRLASEAIKKRYLTRRVIEEAGGAPVSQQLRAMRSSSTPVRQTEQLVTSIPKGEALRIGIQPNVEAMP